MFYTPDIKAGGSVSVCPYRYYIMPYRHFSLRILYICQQVLVLMDVSPDQSMVDEGVARNVANCIQRVRKQVCCLIFPM